MQKISPFLWFGEQAEEAANFYVSLFNNSKIKEITHYGPEVAEASGRPEGSVLTISFELDGQDFVALNGGPHYQLTPAISFSIDCRDQAEVDHFWNALADGGEEMPCGWVTDKFGVTWQVVPSGLVAMLNDPDPVKAMRVTEAMFQMKRLDIDVLRKAYEG